MRRESQPPDLHFCPMEGNYGVVSTTDVAPEASVDPLQSAYDLLVDPHDDARSAKRSMTSHRITVCAQRLAVERGYDEFTLDQLAEAAGVSRRTLFNYFPSKLDAVLGTLPRLTREEAETFLRGGPSGVLMRDLSLLVLRIIEDKRVSGEEWLLSRDCLGRNPKLLVHAQEKFRGSVDAAKQLIAKREGVDSHSPRASVSIGLLAGLFDVTINQFVESDQTRPLSDIYMDNLALAGQLLRGPADS